MAFRSPEPGGTWQQRARAHTFGDGSHPVFIPGHSCYTPCECAYNLTSVDRQSRATMPSLSSSRGRTDPSSSSPRSNRTTRMIHGLPTPSPDRSDASSRPTTPAPSPTPHILPPSPFDPDVLVSSLTEVRRCWHVSTGACEWAFPRLELVLGYAPKQVSPSIAWWKDRIHPEDRLRVLNNLQSFIEARELRFWTEQYRMLASDGSYLNVIDQFRALERDTRSGMALRCLGVLSSPEQTEQVQGLFSNPKCNSSQCVDESKDLFRDMADNSASGFVVLDGAGHPTYMNAAAEAITGWTLDDLRCGPLPCTHAPSEGCSLRDVRSSVREGPHILVHRSSRRVPVVCAVTPLRKGVGSVAELRDVSVDEQARREMVVESEADRARMAESEANRVKLGQFVDFVCHEIRNPLHGIAASAEFLADAVARVERECDVIADGAVFRRPASSLGTSPLVTAPNPVLNTSMREALADVHDYIRSIRECCVHQATITNNVLDLSRLESGKVELLSDVFDPAEAASTCLAMLAARIAEKGIVASLELPIVPFVVRGDRMRYSQVVMNLAGNAVKFTDPGKAITIAISAPEPQIVGDSGEQTLFYTTVRDTGIGMTPAEVSSLFVRFGQLNKRITRDYGGSGLGLNISNELVLLLGGAFHVDSEKGIGTQMRFSVDMGTVPPIEAALWQAQQRGGSSASSPVTPTVVEEAGIPAATDDITRMPTPCLVEEQTLPEMAMHTPEDIRWENASPRTSASSSPATPPAVPAKFAHVLIAEDNVINQMVLSTYLKKLGYTYSACANGREAMDCFVAEQIDAVIMDMEMPILDGREATRLIRAHEGKQDGASPACIIALSGNARPGLMQDAYDTGLDDYLTKPCSMDDLARMLKKWENERAQGTEA